MTERANTPKLRFPEFNTDWTTNQAKNLFTNVSDKKHDGDLLVLSATQDKGMVPRQDLDLEIKYDKKNLSNYKRTLPNDFIISLRSFQGGFELNTIEGIVSPAYTVLRGEEELAQPKFFKQYFKSIRFIKKLDSMIYGIRDGKSISYKEFSTFSINYPSILEQQKIGDFFSKLDRQIELEEEKLELLEQQKKGYMQKIFSQELRFKDKNGDEYPEWQLKNLSELGETFTGLSGKTKDDFGYGDGLFITYMNVFKNTIAKSDMVERVKIEANENQNKVQYGDILFTTSSEVPNEVGMSSIWLFNQDNVYLNSFCFGFRVVVNYIKPVYLARYLRSEEMRKTITILAQGSTRFNISKKEMMKLNIKVPYIEEQIKIDNFFNKIDKLILKQGKKIELLKQRKHGLLQKMFI